MADEKIQEQEAVFPNNNRAKIIAAALGASASSVIEGLGISAPKNLILLIGGAERLDEKLSNRLTELFSRGIARAAADAEALIMDGGTQAGVMAIMGQGVADRGRKSNLLGVAPGGKVRSGLTIWVTLLCQGLGDTFRRFESMVCVRKEVTERVRDAGRGKVIECWKFQALCLGNRTAVRQSEKNSSPQSEIGSRASKHCVNALKLAGRPVTSGSEGLDKREVKT
jgi:hypothetical protein